MQNCHISTLHIMFFFFNLFCHIFLIINKIKISTTILYLFPYLSTYEISTQISFFKGLLLQIVLFLNNNDIYVFIANIFLRMVMKVAFFKRKIVVKVALFKQKIVVKVILFCIILFHLLRDDCQSIPTFF
jgi:hypothetical protein